MQEKEGIHIRKEDIHKRIRRFSYKKRRYWKRKKTFEQEMAVVHTRNIEDVSKMIQ